MASVDASLTMPAAMRADDAARVRKWLLGVAALVALIVIVGGATRLTESGLSITEWDLVTGIFPPMDDRAWVIEFDKYRATPQYLHLNAGMTLSQFQIIYGWEWAHRLIGRLIGVVFIIGFLFFVVTKQLTPILRAKLIGVGVLIGLQGVIGWWMVSSGLVDRVTVAPYRLAAHLTVACAIFSRLIWLARDLDSAADAPRLVPPRLVNGANILIFLVFLQLFLGALVAGNRAGYVYQTWPLMNGVFVPSGLFALEPWWRNWFENLEMVQFSHRISAYGLLVYALWHAFSVRSATGFTLTATRAFIVAGVVALQAGLGIATLVSGMNIAAALMHQAGILLVLTVAVRHRHGLNR